MNSVLVCLVIYTLSEMRNTTANVMTTSPTKSVNLKAGLLTTAVAAKAAAKMKMQAFKAKEKQERLDQLEEEFLQEVKTSKDYYSVLKFMNDDVISQLKEVPDFDEAAVCKIQNAICPRIKEWGMMFVRACFLCVGEDKDRLKNLAAENTRMADKLTELQKRSLQEVVALREKKSRHLA